MKKMTGLLTLILATTSMSAISEKDAGDWLTYGKNLAGWRFSELSQINVENVERLSAQWVFQSGASGKFETTPLVFDHQMYITLPSNHAYALDALTGRPLWHYYSKVPRGINLCCGQVNRGFAVLGDRLFKVNLEATLVALDRRTGGVIWQTELADYKKGYSATAAPLVVRNQVIVGMAGAEFGTRGFIDSYDADTGKRLWRFWTVPKAGEPGSDTWAGDSAERGGGATWITGTYDPELNLLYWGTANPGPDLYGDGRAGDNLYTCSLVALDATTGKLRWYYQFTPHDVHDWDSTSDPVLVDLVHQGRSVKAVIMANRNGFFYALDRTNGKLLHAKAYTKVSWASGIGSDGRPVLIPGNEPSEDGNKTCPGMGGGHNWQGTTYSPQTKLYYFGSGDGCQLFYRTKQDYSEGQWYQGSTVAPIGNEGRTGSILALDPATGETKWRFEMVSPPTSGLLSTAGGLVFAGDAEGYVFALDAQTGKVRWQFQTGGTVISPPVTYLLGGKQYVTVAGASSMLTFAIP